MLARGVAEQHAKQRSAKKTCGGGLHACTQAREHATRIWNPGLVHDGCAVVFHAHVDSCAAHVCAHALAWVSVGIYKD